MAVLHFDPDEIEARAGHGAIDFRIGRRHGAAKHLFAGFELGLHGVVEPAVLGWRRGGPEQGRHAGNQVFQQDFHVLPR